MNALNHTRQHAAPLRVLMMMLLSRPVPYPAGEETRAHNDRAPPHGTPPSRVASSLASSVVPRERRRARGGEAALLERARGVAPIAA